MNSYIIRTDETQAPVAPGFGNRFTLKELQYYVGGYIELVHLNDNQFLVINEEGKLHNLPFNKKATDLAHAAHCIFASDYIVGDAVIIEHNQLD